MPLARFLAELPPSVVVVHAGDAPDLLVRWVEPSELEDPTPYLLPGEFLLTAGLPFQGDGGTPDAVEAYVRRLVAAGVSALGFGIHPYFSEVPDVLVEACRRQALPLVRVPAEVPFAALGLVFARMLEAESLTVLRRLSEANRRLMKAALGQRPEAELLEVLAASAPVWAVLSGADGRIRGRAAGRPLRSGLPEANEVAPLLGRLFAGSGPRIEVDSFGRPAARSVVAYPLRSVRDATLGALVVGSADVLGPVERTIVETAVGLLEALLRERTAGALAPIELAPTLMLRRQAEGASLAGSDAERLAALLAPSASSPRGAGLRVVPLVRAPGGRAAALSGRQKAADHEAPGRSRAGGPRPRPSRGEDEARDLMEWRRVFETKLVARTDAGFAVVSRLGADDGAISEAERLGWLAVVSEETDLAGLPEAYRRTTALRQLALTDGRSVRADAVETSVAGLLGAEAGALLFRAAFAPLEGLEPDRAAALLHVLRGWLEANGSWDASAKSLGLHRNSIRRQIGQLGEILDRDLSDAHTRAALLIALRYAPPGAFPEELPADAVPTLSGAAPGAASGAVPDDPSDAAPAARSDASRDASSRPQEA